jgi:hypothetical protein
LGRDPHWSEFPRARALRPEAFELCCGESVEPSLRTRISKSMFNSTSIACQSLTTDAMQSASL